MGTSKPHSNGPLYRNTAIGSLAVDGRLLHLVAYSEDGTGRAAAPPSFLLAVPNVTAHPSTCYNGPLLCGFNVTIKGLISSRVTTQYQQTP